MPYVISEVINQQRITLDKRDDYNWPTPGVTDHERATILELMAKGSYFGVNLATDDLDGTFAKLEASGAEVVQEPTDQPYGVRDCAIRDPDGNMIRIQERG